MSKRNILAGLAIASALVASPAFADGKDGTRINKGPQPLKARTCANGATGYYDAQGRFICPATRTYTPTTRTYTPTRTSTPTRTITPAPQRISAPAPSFDFTGFTGGVGANVGAGFYGGGGGIVLNTGRAPFSGVLSSPAAALTFNRRMRKSHPMPRPHPCGGCGGMGGMGGGAD